MCLENKGLKCQEECSEETLLSKGLNREKMEVTQISAEGAFQRVRANVKEGARLAETE